ncbi:MAG: hypothetical protein RL173_200 [Fibrobacterota bacterium]
MSSRRYWHFHYGKIQTVVLGPHLRAMEMAITARDCGLEATLVVDDPTGVQIPGVRQVARGSLSLNEIQPGDAVVVSDAAAARIPWQLARKGLAFHADSYGMALPELVKIYPSWTARHAWKDRIRRCLKFGFISRYAEKIYLSHDAQLFLLAGTVFSGRTTTDSSTADSLAEKVLYIPMGVSSPSTSADLPNPYPESIRSRRIFLWGGGIWAWFDTPTLIHAFDRIRDTDAVLFFISGQDHSGLAIHQKALESTRTLAREMGLLGNNVFFNDRSVGPSDLPAYLQHAWSGVMANPRCLEAESSWRTRYLDLLGAGLPLVVSGRDPLALRMESGGAALLSSAGDINGLASNLRKLTQDSSLKSQMGAAAKSIGSKMHWNTTLAPLRDVLQDPNSFQVNANRPPLNWLLRYAFASITPKWNS